MSKQLITKTEFKKILDTFNIEDEQSYTLYSILGLVSLFYYIYWILLLGIIITFVLSFIIISPLIILEHLIRKGISKWKNRLD